MRLLDTDNLEQSGIVANCRMNRERNLTGHNGYEKDLRFNPLAFLREALTTKPNVRWLDLCCGSGKALIEAAEVVEFERLPVEIVGIDLVGMFQHSRFDCLKLVTASLSNWQPPGQFDLITCVHGLHYLGDKLQTLTDAASWLTDRGRFIANLDMNNIKLQNGTANREVTAELRRVGFGYSFRTKLLQRDGRIEVHLPFRFLGADDQAGPNYTGQDAVDSYYERILQ